MRRVAPHVGVAIVPAVAGFRVEPEDLLNPGGKMLEDVDAGLEVVAARVTEKDQRAAMV